VRVAKTRRVHGGEGSDGLRIEMELQKDYT